MEETKDEPTDHDEFEDAQQDDDDNWEPLKTAEETTVSTDVPLEEAKYKIWIVGQICCCLKGQEAVKVGVVTDVP